MENERLQYLVKKYAGNGITGNEEAELMEFIHFGKDLEYLRELMVHIWDDKQPQFEMDEANADQIFEKVVGSTRSVSIRRFSWIGWAAVLLLFCSVAVFFFYQKEPKAPQSLQQVATIKIFSGTAHKKVNLPDGSSVILNDHSSMTYTRDFSEKSREVVLTGEGYFDIKHNATRTFIVHSGKVKTTVLGTAFNIKALAGKPVVVTVTRGKVSVEDEGKTLTVLVPNQQVTLSSADKKKVEPLKVKAEESIAWQKNDLFFEDATMEEAADLLSQRFNVKISFNNNAGKNCRFTATFLKAQDLEEVIKVITAFNGATYTTKPGQIIISGNNCENNQQ